MTYSYVCYGGVYRICLDKEVCTIGALLLVEKDTSMRSCAVCWLQGIAVCCSVLQCVVVCSSVLQCVAVSCSVLQCVTVCCSVLQCGAMRHSVLQCVAVCCTAL